MAHTQSYTSTRPISSSSKNSKAEAIRTKPSHQLKVTSTDTYTAALRTFLGIVFVVSGLNGFFAFLPQFEVSQQGVSFIEALQQAHFWPVFKVIEILVGGALLFNVFAQFAIFILAPITMAILLFHVFVSRPGAWFAWTIFAAEMVMVVAFWPRIRQVFFPRHSADRGKVIHDDPR